MQILHIYISQDVVYGCPMLHRFLRCPHRECNFYILNFSRKSYTYGVKVGLIRVRKKAITVPRTFLDKTNMVRISVLECSRLGLGLRLVSCCACCGPVLVSPSSRSGTNLDQKLYFLTVNAKFSHQTATITDNFQEI